MKAIPLMIGILLCVIVIFPIVLTIITITWGLGGSFKKPYLAFHVLINAIVGWDDLALEYITKLNNIFKAENK